MVRFLQKIEEKVSKETIDKFYAMVKPVNANNRWYDKDPVISKTVEILRIVPPEAQRLCAQNFIKTLKDQPLVLPEWDEQLWARIVESVTLHSSGKADVRFVSGTCVSVDLP